MKLRGDQGAGGYHLCGRGFLRANMGRVGDLHRDEKGEAFPAAGSTDASQPRFLHIPSAERLTWAFKAVKAWTCAWTERWAWK